MPLTSDEYDLGRADLSLAILHLLRLLADVAFNDEELQKLLRDRLMRDATLVEVGEAAQRLVQQKRVEAREVDGQFWYLVRRPGLGFRKE